MKSMGMILTPEGIQFRDSPLKRQDAVFNASEVAFLPYETKVVQIQTLQGKDKAVFQNELGSDWRIDEGLVNGKTKHLLITNLTAAPTCLAKGKWLGRTEGICCTAEELIRLTEKLPDKKELLKPTKTDIEFVVKNAKICCEDKKYRKKYLDLVLKYHSVFSRDEFDVGLAEGFRHKIVMKKEGMPVFVKQFPLPEAAMEAVQDYVQRMMKSGVIQRSHSDFNTPIFVIRKKDGKWRILQDYRFLNAETVVDKTVFKNVQDCLNEVARAKSSIFSCVDLKGGYYHCMLEEGSKKKTAFTLAGEKYEFQRLAMGLHGAPASFAKMMAYITEGVPNLLVYLDDLMAHCRDHEEMLATLEQLLDRMSRYNMKLSLQKCTFGGNNCTFLGNEVSGIGITPMDCHVKALKEAKAPNTMKRLRSFLGFCNFFRQFLPKYARTVAPLSALTRQGSGWRGGTAA